MKPLTKGDPCRVRLHTGEVVEAVYVTPSEKKCHFVEVNGVTFYALSNYHLKWRPYGLETSECRFVGPACVLVPVGVSV